MLLKTIRLILTFYKNFFFTALFITLSCCLVYWLWKTMPIILVVLFWFKIATYIAIVYHIHHTKRKEFYYYQSLGVSKIISWTVSLVFDLTLFVFCMIITNTIYNA